MLTRIVTQPSVEPVTLAEVKEHLRIDHSDHDTMISALIQASREHIEGILGRALVQQTRVALYKYWPDGDVFEIPYPPLQNITSLTYTDTAGTVYTFDSDNYSVDTDSEPGRLVLGYNKLWPTSTILHDPEYSIAIEYVCGYTPSDDSPEDYRANIPESIKNAIKLDVEIRYDKKEGYMEKLQNVVDMLISPYKVFYK